ncbi:MAG: hypothetical protein JO360_08175 [Acidobacteria bacterium]|nr:hypothetical protein [Acidobacteriota bacterium]
MRKLAPFFAAFLLLAAAQLAAAQDTTVPHIPLGLEQARVTFSGGSVDPIGNFTFAGNGMTLTGWLTEGAFSPQCLPCQGGDEISIRTTYSGEQSIRAGTLTINGVSRDVYYAGAMVFDGNRVTLPTRYSRLPFTVTFPITLQGHLQVHRFNPFNNSTGLLFELPLKLHGTARLTLSVQSISPLNGRPFYRFRGLSYELSAAADTLDK